MTKCEGGDRIVVFGNPKAGSEDGRGRADALVEKLRARGYRVDVIQDVVELKKSTREDVPLKAVVAAGGDGTAELVVNHTPPDAPIAIYPLGTENLLAKYLKIPADIELWCRFIDEPVSVHLDAGRVKDRLFLLMLSSGFDAEVVRRLHTTRRGNISHMSYAKPILAAIRSYKYPELVIRHQDASGCWWEQKAHWVFVFNIPAYAGGLRITPHADPADGCLDVCTYVGGSFLAGLFHLGTVFSRRQGDWSNFRRERAKSVHIESATDVPFQVDGDPGGTLPVDVHVVPGRLRLLVPPDWPISESIAIP